jgi:hypothetical protein
MNTYIRDGFLSLWQILLKPQIILIPIKSDSHKILNKYLPAHYIILQISYKLIQDIYIIGVIAVLGLG